MVACLRRLAVSLPASDRLSLSFSKTSRATVRGMSGRLKSPSYVPCMFVPPDGEGRPGGEASYYGQAVLHESGPAVQRQEQRGGQQTGGQTGQLRPALGPTGPESGDEQLSGAPQCSVVFHHTYQVAMNLSDPPPKNLTTSTSQSSNQITK